LSPPSPGIQQPDAPHVAARPTRDSAPAVSQIIRSREFSVVIVLAMLCLFMLFTGARGSFYSQRNVENVLRQVALLSVFAIGETIVIITGGIDLSLGSLIAFTGMVMALLVTKLSATLVMGPAIIIAILVTLVAALAIGGIHATLIHRLRLPPFVVTLASLLILRSQSMLMNEQLPITIQDFPPLLWLANGTLFEGSRFAIPVPIVIMGVVAVAVGFMLSRARIGRYLYSVGSNEQATQLSGVNVYKVKLFAYGVSGLLGGLAGILWASYGGQGDPLAGSAYELDAVAAAVVGGASLSGGRGSIIGTILGALLLHTILSAINLTLSAPDRWRGTVVGGVLLFAVLVTAIQQRRAG
jgi:ribose transport system permease protein